MCPLPDCKRQPIPSINIFSNQIHFPNSKITNPLYLSASSPQIWGHYTFLFPHNLLFPNITSTFPFIPINFCLFPVTSPALSLRSLSPRNTKPPHLIGQLALLWIEQLALLRIEQPALLWIGQPALLWIEQPALLWIGQRVLNWIRHSTPTGNWAAMTEPSIWAIAVSIIRRLVIRLDFCVFSVDHVDFLRN